MSTPSTPAPAHPPPGTVLNIAGTQYVDATNDSYGNYGQPLILNKIFELLVQMINVIQKTAAAQANRLNFLTAWQKAYTDEMNQVHAFVGGNGDASNNLTLSAGQPHIKWDFGGLDSEGSKQATQIRGDLNTANTTYTQQMQANNQVISNDAKQLQTNVNESNSAVQSQTDMATSILQQMATILTSIYQTAA
jgi:hypothetical protein